MRLTKHAHACVEISTDDGHVLIDPGVYAPKAAELIAETDAILLTHEHPDHVHAEAILAALAARPGLRVWGPAAVVGEWVARFPAQVVAVAPGDAFGAGGLDVTVHGGLHAVIHPDLPRFVNVGYLVDGRIYHPGDSYEAPGVGVEVLLVPVSGPWARFGDAADLVRAVAPARAIQIHDAMLSEIGIASATRFLSAGALVKVDVEHLAPGESVEI
ncbi:MBL fold metallo-hydrolase [Demequina mangrovi]|uniref:L-ascorbate metabolism protein UlaG, beta-lactamase superfamily n=1 Tax=Demequina mangrovi TaxID=1043493 RepID=A0A1H6V1P4_9MICO|nr:MBL fold metallo-hydrolase [Demequina mangrovi]SEI97806.1 L-ascorbate metabolism protein UlaG, beta-lactamase superfamily [Demequina mangrovi]